MRVLMREVKEDGCVVSRVFNNDEHLCLTRSKADANVSLDVNGVTITMRDPSVWLSMATMIAYEPCDAEKELYVGESGYRHMSYDDLFSLMCDASIGEEEEGWWEIDINYVNNTCWIHFMEDEPVFVDNIDEYIRRTYQYEEDFYKTEDDYANKFMKYSRYEELLNEYAKDKKLQLAINAKYKDSDEQK